MLTIKKKIAAALADGIAALGAPDALSCDELALMLVREDSLSVCVRTLLSLLETVLEEQTDKNPMRQY